MHNITSDWHLKNLFKESRKCEKRRYFNKKAKCRMGYFKCATDPNLKLIKSTYQEALKKCKNFSSINETGKGKQIERNMVMLATIIHGRPDSLTSGPRWCKGAIRFDWNDYYVAHAVKNVGDPIICLTPLLSGPWRLLALESAQSHDSKDIFGFKIGES